MKFKTVFIVCVSLSMLAATAVAGTDKSDVKHSDEWLKAQIVTTYTLNQPLNPFKLDVEVKKGVAHLSGTVDSPAERDLAVEIARGVDGITDVEENIRIEPGAKAEERRDSEFYRTVEDATITFRVKSKLLWNRNTKGLKINVKTENGVVTLEGKVFSDAQRDLAVQLAKNTNGAVQVKENLEVVPESKKAEKKGTLETMETKANNAWITTKVKSMLLFSKEASGAEINVDTTDQVVTLEGTVTDDAQKEKILKMVGDMVGVKRVQSKLTVEKGEAEK